MQSTALLPTPQDAEAAFYEAFERSDLDALMAVWADEDEIYCILPGGARVQGHAAIRATFAQVFENSPRMQVQLSQAVQLTTMMLVVHTVVETITAHTPAGPQRANPIVATNVYQRSGAGWRMMAHHASPTPAQARPATRTERPRTLH